MKHTGVFYSNLESYDEGNELIINQGGSSSSKTWSILQLLYVIAKKRSDNNEPVLISVVAETFPALKKGAMRDFLSMLEIEGQYKESNHNRTDAIYHVGQSQIEFFSADNKDKVHGPRRDILFINECNNVKFEVFEQLWIRTRESGFLDYNPVQEFWVHTKVIPNYNHAYIHSTYIDNDYLPEKQIRDIERFRDTDKNKWRVYGLGETGNIEGLIFPNWKYSDFMPNAFRWRCYGLDFGYTNDPTATVDAAYYQGELFIDELIYETGLTNKDITAKFRQIKVDKFIEMFADSAEPKSIEEIRRDQYNIKPTIKGKDSVVSGIDKMKSVPLNITKRSVNLAKELRNYTWMKDKDGNYMNKPIDAWNHAIDASRYASTMKLGNKRKGIIAYG